MDQRFVRLLDKIQKGAASISGTKKASRRSIGECNSSREIHHEGRLIQHVKQGVLGLMLHHSAFLKYSRACGSGVSAGFR